MLDNRAGVDIIDSMDGKCLGNFVNKEPLSGCVCAHFPKCHPDRHGRLMVFCCEEL